jgi:hypothetical protein
VQAVILLERGAPPVFSVAEAQALLARLHEAAAVTGAGAGTTGAVEPRLQVVQLALTRAVAAAFLHEADAATAKITGGFSVY